MLEFFERFLIILFFFCVVYIGFWCVFMFAYLEFFNPLQSEGGRYVAGVGVLLSFIASLLAAD